MKLEKNDNVSGTEGDKRHYMPYIFKWNCKKCNKEIESDFNIDYFSYPPIGEPFEHDLYYDCDCGCENHIKKKFIIKQVLELVDDGKEVKKNGKQMDKDKIRKN